MDATSGSEATLVRKDATVERRSERELIVTRTVNAPPHIVWEAWTRSELFERWWVPKSFPISLLSCELDARVGGRYRLVLGYEGSTMEFFGRYLEVEPASRLSWTNEEAEDGGPITTVTFEEIDGRTRLVVHELHPSKEALDEAIASGSSGMDAMPESLGQLDELLGGQGASVEPASVSS
jgi:uncharacterized protein YndB with AHSA1/START domain